VADNFSIKTYVIDIDGTICTQNGSNYQDAEPVFEVIEVANSLFKNGHQIVYFTARGTTTGIDWTDLTKSQLLQWGALHTKLIMGKPFADFYIDDKSLSISNFLNHKGEENFKLN
jgi:phosphatidate phosphatase PAH1